MSRTEFNFDESSFWRRGLQDLDLFQCCGHMKSAVVFAMQNKILLRIYSTSRVSPRPMWFIFSHSRDRVSTLFFAGQEEDSSHHDVCSLLQQDGSIPHFYDLIPG